MNVIFGSNLVFGQTICQGQEVRSGCNRNKKLVSASIVNFSSTSLESINPLTLNVMNLQSGKTLLGSINQNFTHPKNFFSAFSKTE